VHHHLRRHLEAAGASLIPIRGVGYLTVELAALFLVASCLGKTAEHNNVDPRAWLADLLRRIAGHPASLLHELLCWNRKRTPQATAACSSTGHGSRWMLTLELRPGVPVMSAPW